MSMLRSVMCFAVLAGCVAPPDDEGVQTQALLAPDPQQLPVDDGNDFPDEPVVPDDPPPPPSGGLPTDDGNDGLDFPPVSDEDIERAREQLAQEARMNCEAELSQQYFDAEQACSPYSLQIVSNHCDCSLEVLCLPVFEAHCDGGNSETNH